MPPPPVPTAPEAKVLILERTMPMPRSSEALSSRTRVLMSSGLGSFFVEVFGGVFFVFEGEEEERKYKKKNRTNRILLPVELPRDRERGRGLAGPGRAVEEEVRELRGLFLFFGRQRF